MTSRYPGSKRLIDAGIRFECTECGKCCTGAPGAVYVSDSEIEEIAEFLGMPIDEFIGVHVHRVHGCRSLRERENYDCVFFRDKKCTIYEVRPTQCRTWPFWKNNLRTSADWQETCEGCPGIGKGHRYTSEEILARVDQLFGRAAMAQATGNAKADS